MDKVIHRFNNKKNDINRLTAGLQAQMVELERVRERLLVEYREIESRSDHSPRDREDLDQRLAGLRNNLKAVETKMQVGAANIKDFAKQAAKFDEKILKPAATKELLADEKKISSAGPSRPLEGPGWLWKKTWFPAPLLWVCTAHLCRKLNFAMFGSLSGPSNPKMRTPPKFSTRCRWTICKRLFGFRTAILLFYLRS
jgi:hypothetical protein